MTIFSLTCWFLLSAYHSYAQGPRTLIEDVTFKSGNVTIAGVLNLPSAHSQLPAAILVSGDGSTSRDEPMLVELGSYLNGIGFAILRTDKRGVGLSSGNLEAATTEDLAVDVEAGIRFLRHDSRIDSHRVGIVGHSEGALIAAMVAARLPDTAFSILLAHPTVGIEEILHLQREKRLRAQGAGAHLLDSERNFWKQIFSLVRKDAPADTILKNASALISDRPPALTEGYRKQGIDSMGSLKEMLPELKTPWLEWLLAYDPSKDLAEIRCPTLALFCGKDWQVLPEENREAMTAALGRRAGRDFSIQVLPGLNHHFQESVTGSPDEYEDLEDGPAPVALQAIGEWLAGR